jgi:hypothetical protein
MITGIVNAELEPIIPLSIRGADGKIYTDFSHQGKFVSPTRTAYHRAKSSKPFSFFN